MSICNYQQAHPWSRGHMKLAEIMVDEWVSLPIQQLSKSRLLAVQKARSHQWECSIALANQVGSCNCVSVSARKNSAVYSFSPFHHLKVKSKAKASVFKLLVDKGSSSYQECVTWSLVRYVHLNPTPDSLSQNLCRWTRQYLFIYLFKFVQRIKQVTPISP